MKFMEILAPFITRMFCLPVCHLQTLRENYRNVIFPVDLRTSELRFTCVCPLFYLSLYFVLRSLNFISRTYELFYVVWTLFYVV